MPRILVVEDDRGLSALLQDWLTGEQHEVTAVYTGAEAWDLMQGSEYDFIVMDWDLPDAKGPDLISNFRAAGGITPVIMLTGHSSIADKEAGLDAGANDYLTKPFHVKELSARIRAVMRTQSVAPPPPKSLGQGNEDVLRAANLTGTSLAARYEILDIVGSGSSALVLKARHPGTGRLVAVKVLFPGLFRPEQVERFQWEADSISELDQDNIAKIYDYGLTERGQPFLVMEYVQGEALRERMARDRQLPLVTAVTILIQVCRGLQEVHDKGIVHGDIRPENILLQEGSSGPDWVKVGDFCLSPLVTPGSLKLSRSGTSIKTAEYAAPERVEGAIAVVLWDIYSLGIMLFEMLTGRMPFEADTVESVMISAMLEVVQPPSQFRNDIAPGSALDELVSRATEKNPDMRYQTAAELLADLEQIRADLS